MFGSQILDTGIGLAVLFFFMSVVATALCELIENIVKLRAKFLETGIQQLLHAASTGDLTKQFYEHPLIASLYDGTYRPGSTSLPSYIPRQSFSVALLELVASGSPVLSVASLKTSLAAQPNPNPVQRMVLSAINTAGDDLGEVRKFLEDAFDATMDRVSGWYKRRNGRILLAIGLLAAVILNVDAIAVGRSLMLDPDLRNAAVAQAAPVLAMGTDGKTVGSAQLPELRKHIDAIGLPIFWGYKDGRIYPKAQTCHPTLDTGAEAGTAECGPVWIGVLKAVPGWIVTMLAISLGAPFWFDILNKLVIVRSTVKPKEKSLNEGSKDAKV